MIDAVGLPDLLGFRQSCYQNIDLTLVHRIILDKADTNSLLHRHGARDLFMRNYCPSCLLHLSSARIQLG